MTFISASTLLLIAAVLLLAGSIMLALGLRGKRVGDEPRCSKCGYNLFGLTSERCPECGSIASGKNVVVGVRRRRWRLLGLGLFCLLVSVSWLGLVGYGRAKGINWYPYLPTFVVLQQAKADSFAAVTELNRRYTAGQIESDRLLALVPHALDRLAPDGRSPIVWAWWDLLVVMDAKGVLAEAQKEQLYERVFWSGLDFRPRVRQGEEVVFRNRGAAFVPGLDVRCKIVDAEGRIGEHQLELFSLPGDSAPSIQPFDTSRLEPGAYQVSFHAKRLFLYGGDESWDEPSLAREVRQEYPLEILPADSPDPLRLIADPSLASEFLAAIRFRMVFLLAGGSPGPWQPELMISVDDRVPMDGAFDLFVLVGGREIRLGEFLVRRDESPALISSVSWNVECGEARYFVPILRASADVARNTSDIFEIWDGELRFDPVEIPQSPPPAGAVQRGPSAPAYNP
jgi:hypothetical protein